MPAAVLLLCKRHPDDREPLSGGVRVAIGSYRSENQAGSAKGLEPVYYPKATSRGPARRLGLLVRQASLQICASFTFAG